MYSSPYGSPIGPPHANPSQGPLQVAFPNPVHPHAQDQYQHQYYQAQPPRKVFMLMHTTGDELDEMPQIFKGRPEKLYETAASATQELKSKENGTGLSRPEAGSPLWGTALGKYVRGVLMWRTESEGLAMKVWHLWWVEEVDLIACGGSFGGY